MKTSNPGTSGIWVVAAILSAALTACGGGGGAAAPTPPPQPPSSFGPNFSEIQSNVFTPTCAVSGCHLGAGAPQGLRLDDVNSYGLLVDVPSMEVPGVLRVAPGDPDNSYVIQKLEGTAAIGGRMPLGRPPLDQSVIDIIRQWISAGAIDDRTATTNPIRVTSLSPPPNSNLTSAPASIIAMFDRELDVSTVNLNTFILEGSGGDGTFNDGNEVTIVAASITASGGAPMSATFDLSGIALADDTYRVRLLGSGASFIMDLDANALDGEYLGVFPTGDGTQGGDFEALFSLSTAALSPTLDAIQASVFGPTCATSLCHSGTGTILPGVMDLTTADASFASLVGIASIQQPTRFRVAAGDPDMSYLVHKIEGIAPLPNNSRMPLGGLPLDQALIDNIRLWISNGANR